MDYGFSAFEIGLLALEDQSGDYDVFDTPAVMSTVNAIPSRDDLVRTRMVEAFLDTGCTHHLVEKPSMP